MRFSNVAAGALLAFSLASPAAEIDEEAAKAVYRSPSNSCAKCHAIDKQKEGPSLRQLTEKYKDNPEAEQKLVDHLTRGPAVKFRDGHEEDHRTVENASPERLRNFVRWMLSQQ
jgi:cytochrome c